MKTEFPTDAPTAREERVSASATVVVAAGLAAAWIAAGSSGHLAEPLQHVLTVLTLAIGIVAGWPFAAGFANDWIVLVFGAVIGIAMALVPNEVVNVLAVVIVFSTLSGVRGGVDGRAMRVAAQAVLGFAALHLVFAACPNFWLVGDGLGRSLGRAAETVTRQPLLVGSTFAGVDFLLLMSMLYGLWLLNTAPPRRTRAIAAAVAILAAQLFYLVVLAFADKIAAAVDPIYPIEDDYMRIGVSAWQNTVRVAIPWNVPAIGLLLQTLVAAAMFRWARWPAQSASPRQPPSKVAKTKPQAAPEATGQSGRIAKYGPLLAAVFLAATATLWAARPDLNGKTIVAYRGSDVAWTTPRVASDDNNGYALLPDFVKSLGGNFVLSRSLAAVELARADAVLLLKPDARFTGEQEAHLTEFLARGGSLLVASDANAHCEAILKSSGIRIESARARGRTESWEQAIGAIAHPATMGVSDARHGFGVDTVSALQLRWPALPMLVGRYGRTDAAAKEDASLDEARLGDSVLIAESRGPGGGKIVVMGDAACLGDDLLPVSYEFAGRLLGYLVQKSPAFPLWRTTGILILAVIMIVFVATMRQPAQLATTALAFAATLVFCEFCTLKEQQITPGEPDSSSRKIALIDASHIEAYSDQLRHPSPTVEEFSGKDWRDPGLSNFARTLTQIGYLPLRMRTWSPAQLERASLFIAIAPARRYAESEAESLQEYVEAGGTLVCMVGAEESRAINPLLARFNLSVPHSPVRPDEAAREPEPIGAKTLRYVKNEKDEEDQVDLFAAWGATSLTIGSEGEQFEPFLYRDDKTGRVTMVGARRVGHGWVAVIADTHFAANENPDPMRFEGETESARRAKQAKEANERFWQWFLPQIARPEAIPKGKKSDTPPKMPSEGESMKESGPDEG
jgi:hypothetical protein